VHLRPSFLHISHTTSLPCSLHWIFLERQTSHGLCFLERYLRPFESCCCWGGTSSLIDEVNVRTDKWVSFVATHESRVVI